MGDKELSLFEWTWLMVIALVAMPVAGMLGALATLALTQSLEAQVATAIALPLAAVLVVARWFGAPGGVAFRLALLGALSATVLLDLGWSGAPGA